MVHGIGQYVAVLKLHIHFSLTAEIPLRIFRMVLHFHNFAIGFNPWIPDGCFRTGAEVTLAVRQIVCEHMLGAEATVFSRFGFGAVHDFPQRVKMKDNLFNIIRFDVILRYNFIQYVNKIMGEKTESPLFKPGIIRIKRRLTQAFDHFIKFDILITAGEHIQAFFNDRIARGAVFGKHGIDDRILTGSSGFMKVGIGSPGVHIPETGYHGQTQRGFDLFLGQFKRLCTACGGAVNADKRQVANSDTIGSDRCIHGDSVLYFLAHIKRHYGLFTGKMQMIRSGKQRRPGGHIADAAARELIVLHLRCMPEESVDIGGLCHICFESASIDTGFRSPRILLYISNDFFAGGGPGPDEHPHDLFERHFFYMIDHTGIHITELCVLNEFCKSFCNPHFGFSFLNGCQKQP